MKKILASLLLSLSLVTASYAQSTTGNQFSTHTPNQNVIGVVSMCLDSSGFAVPNNQGGNCPGGGGGGGGAVFGPTAVGSAAANPPVLVGGTSDGTANGLVGVLKVVGGSAFINCANCSGSGISVGFGSAIGSVGTPNGYKDVSGNFQPILGDVTNGQWVSIKSSVSIPVTGTFFQATQPISAASLPLPTGAATQTTSAAILSALGTPFQANGSIGNTSFGISGTLPAFAATPTVNLGTIGGVATQTTLASVLSALGGNLTVVQSTGTNLHMVCDSGCSSSSSPSFGSAFPTTGTPIGMSQGGLLTALTGTSGNLNVQCANCSGSGVSTADAASFTAGTSLFAGGGGFFQTTATSNPLTTGQQGMFQVTANRALFTNLRNASGVEIGTASTPVQVSLANTAANGTALLVTGTGGTFPITAASLPLPTGAATSANQPTNAAAASTTSGQTGNLHMGAVTTAAPTYTTATSNFLSLTTAGALRVDGSGVTQPVSGTVAFSNSSIAVTQATASSLNATVVGTGTFAVQSAQSGTWNIANISGTISLPTGAATSANQPTNAAIGSTTSGQTGNLHLAAVTTAAPTYTTGQSNPLSLNTSGGLRVDGSGVTQPVSIASAVTVAQATAANLNATVVQSGNWTTRGVGNAGASLDFAGQNATGTINSLLVGGQFNTSPTTITSGNFSPFQLDTNGNLKVNVAVGGGTGGTSSSFGAAFPGTGTAAGMSQGGNMVAMTGTAGNLNVQCANCSGSGASAVDEAAMTFGTSVFAPMGGVFQTTATSNPLTSGQQGMAQLTINRALHINLRNSTGVEIGNSTTPVQVSLANTAANGTAILVTGTGGTFPITAASLPLPTGAATSANQPTNATIGSTTSGQTGGLSMGAVTTAAPTYTTAQTNPLSLTTAGALRVDGSAVTQPVSIASAVTVAQATAGNLNATVVGTGTFAVQATLQATATTAIGKVDPNTIGSWGLQASTQNSATPTNGGLILGQFNTTPTTITSGNVSPIQLDSAGNLLVNIKAGASSGAVAQGSTTSGQTGGLIQAAATTAAPSYTTATTNPLSMDLAGNLRSSVIGNQPASTTMQSAATANGNGTSLPVNGYSVVYLDVNCSVACSGGTTINVEAAGPSGTFNPISAYGISGTVAGASSPGSVTNVTTTNQLWVPVGPGLTSLRARISSYGSGTVTVTGTPGFGGPPASQTQVSNSNANGQQAMAASSPVVIASNQSAIANNITQINGSTGGITTWGTAPTGQSVLSANVNCLSGCSSSTAQQAPLNAGTATATNAGVIGGQFLTTQPTMTNTQQASILFSSRGELLVAPGVSGFNVTNGGTFAVQATLQASSNIVGNVRIDQTTPGTTNGTQDASTGSTGSAVPSKAAYVGAASSGNLTGIIQADNSAAINVSTATTTQLVALTSGQKIYITSFDVIAAGTGNITFEYGTGTNCATGTTVLTGAYNLTAQSGLSKGSGLGPVLVVPAGNALCVLTSAAVQMSGSVSYTKF